MKTVACLPIPSALAGAVENYWHRFVDAIVTLSDDGPSSDLPASDLLELCSSRPELGAVWAASDFVAKTCIGAPLLLYDLISSGDLDQPYAPGELFCRIKASLGGCEDEADLHTQLRQIRQREMVRMAWRDLCGAADLEETMQCVSELAESCIGQALIHHHNWLSRRYGPPRNENGDRANLIVLGLGKLGGRELNYSSDVDLIFAYDSPGQTTPIDNQHDKAAGIDKPGIDNQEFFIKLGRKIVSALDTVTRDGFVFRTDMRLRPNGDSGPLVLSFPAMEHYYQTHGRNWERYALIKARVVAGDKDSGTELLALLKPFVYRKYLDFGAFDAIREMKSMIERALKQTEVNQNIKLGWGGIREIEFLVQSHQLIRGGREKNLQTQSLYQALSSLVELGVIDDGVLQQLLDGYRFLRNTEHRLQMVADRQTQQLPQSGIEQQRLAWSMGFENWSAYVEKLDQHRAHIHSQFKMILDADTQQTNRPDATRFPLADVWAQTLQQQEAVKLLHAAGFAQASSTAQLLRGFREGRLYQAFSGIERDRIDRLMPLALQQAAQHAGAERAMAAFVSVVEAIGRRSVYLSLLIENPIALKQLLHLCAASPWISSHIGRHPVILDELLRPLAGPLAGQVERPLAGQVERPLVDIRNRSDQALYAELNHRLAQVDLNDQERRGDTLREYQQAQILRIAAADVSGVLQVDDVHHALTQLAEVLLQTVFCDAVKFVEKKFGAEKFGVKKKFVMPDSAGGIAYGKLASGELGYNSDLDIVVCYEKTEGDDADHSEAEHFYSRVGRRFIHLLTAHTQAGILYRLDLRLRPSGRSGILVTSLSGFFDYQFNSAWTWEHQALVRARVVVGNAEFQRKFEVARKAILCLKRDNPQLKDDVISMRRKMIDVNCRSTDRVYDIKLDEGGIVDIEFLIQYWILRHANEHVSLAIPRTTADCIDALIEHSIIDANTGRQLLNCYATYLRHSLDLKLMERPVLVEQGALLAERGAINAIWNKTFG